MRLKKCFDVDAFFIRRFPRFREIEARCRELEKKSESDEALIASLNRYIEALEGRDNERIRRIDELESLCAEILSIVNEQLRTVLDSLRNWKETPAIKTPAGNDHRREYGGRTL